MMFFIVTSLSCGSLCIDGMLICSLYNDVDGSDCGSDMMCVFAPNKNGCEP